VRVDPAKPHDVRVGRELIAERLDELPGIQAIIADRGYRGLAKLAARKHVRLDIKTPPQGTTGFTPLWPLYKVDTPSRGSGGGGGCRAAMRARRQAPAPGSKWRPWATC
jgi:hypothetical protein